MKWINYADQMPPKGLFMAEYKNKQIFGRGLPDGSYEYFTPPGYDFDQKDLVRWKPTSYSKD